MAPYISVIAAVSAVTAADDLCRRVLGEQAPLLVLGLVIVAAAILGGTGPALLATALGTLALGYYLVPPARTFAAENTAERVHLVFFVLCGLLVGLVAGLVRRARRAHAGEHERIAAFHEERRSAEQARLALERRFQTVFESHLAPLAIMENDGPVLEANDAFLRLTGYTREQLAEGRIHWREMTPPAWHRQAEAAARPGSFGPIEKEYQRPDGQRVPLLVGGSIMPGEPGTTLVFAVDLSERKRMERELRDSEARMRRLWESNIIGVLHSTGGGAILDGNDSGLRMLGFTREDLKTGRADWREVTPPEEIEHDARGIAEARERGACTPYEKTYVTKDGRRVPTLIGYALLGGPREEYICFLHDLTEQKRAESALAAQITKAITDHASAALFMVDDHGRCRFMNPAAEAMTGYTFAEIEGRSLHDAIHHHHPDGQPFAASECTVKRVIADGPRLETHQDVYFRKNGERFPVICSANRIERPGQPPMLLLEVRDITVEARIAAEREMLLDSERAARAEVERESRAKDEFVAMLSHELRTPLNAVLGWSALARRPAQTAEQRQKALEIVERNGRLLAQIIADLFDVSRVVSGKLHVELGPVDLPATVEAALDAVRSAAEAKGIALGAFIADGDTIVLGDAARLQQVVWNLVSNAIKFTPRGGHVEVSLARRSHAIELSVSDTGQGIEAEFLPYVFDRFRQAEASLARRHGGLGIGLAIVRHLVELHGGTVRAESAGRGAGARFVVELPLQPALLGAAASAPPPSCKLTGTRILVVDDEPDAKELVKRLLEEQGASVTTASSAAEALDALAAGPLDALVSDIGMPGMDGYEMMRRVRAGTVAREVPAVAVTAYARPEDRARALGAGFQAHVSKPVEPTEMLAAVASVIGCANEVRAQAG
ncbi:MAG: PAS domain S-box protein [Minicystis sp.]